MHLIRKVTVHAHGRGRLDRRANGRKGIRLALTSAIHSGRRREMWWPAPCVRRPSSIARQNDRLLVGLLVIPRSFHVQGLPGITKRCRGARGGGRRWRACGMKCGRSSLDIPRKTRSGGPVEILCQPAEMGIFSHPFSGQETDAWMLLYSRESLVSEREGVMRTVAVTVPLFAGDEQF